MTEIKHTEQYDFENNVAMHILKVNTNLIDNKFTICWEKTNTKQWQYSNISYDSLKEAFEAFDKEMSENAPTIQKHVIPVGWRNR